MIPNNPLLVDDEQAAKKNRERIAATNDSTRAKDMRYLGLDTLPTENPSLPVVEAYRPISDIVNDTRRMSPKCRNWK